MTRTSPFVPKFAARLLAKVLPVFAAVVLTLSSGAYAAEQQRPQLSEKMAEELGKLQPLLDQKNWNAAIEMLAKLYSGAQPDSYDAAMVSNILWQVYLQRAGKADYASAIPILERVVHSRYFEESRLLDPTYFLAQLYLQEGNQAKAEEYAKRYIDKAPNPAADRIVFYAYLLLQRANPPAQTNPDGTTTQPKVDEAVAKDALSYLERGLKAAYNPPENLYLLKAVALQALNRNAEGAEIMELLVKKNPQNKQHWQQLQNFYLLSGQELRAALTIERAQQFGHLNTPRDNLALVSIYYNMQQLAHAAKLLEKGLAEGGLEQDVKNYDLLAECYKQTHYELKAIETYKKAAEKFKSSQHFIQIAGLYYGMDKQADTLRYLEQALALPEVKDRPAMTLFAVYVAFEVRNYDKAKQYLTQAESIVKTDKEKKDYENLKQAVEDAARIAEAKPAA